MIITHNSYAIQCNAARDLRLADLKQRDRRAGEQRVRAQREIQRQRVLSRIAHDAEVERKSARTF